MWEGEPSCKCPQGKQDCNEAKGWWPMKSQKTTRESDSIGMALVGKGDRGHQGEFGGKNKRQDLKWDLEH